MKRNGASEKKRGTAVLLPISTTVTRAKRGSRAVDLAVKEVLIRFHGDDQNAGTLVNDDNHSIDVENNVDRVAAAT